MISIAVRSVQMHKEGTEETKHFTAPWAAEPIVFVVDLIITQIVVLRVTLCPLLNIFAVDLTRAGP